jgi:predicted secreted protein
VKAGEGSYKSIGFATNHTLSTSASTISVSHKDLADAGSGKWDDQDIDTLSWTITSENFYANEAEGVTFADLWNYYAAGTVLDLKFGVAADSTTGVPDGGWVVPATGTVLSGKAIISSVDVNAPVDENANFSITFTGKGALTVGA